MLSEYPWLPIVGIGTGQFSSRAGLIGTGMYFGSPANPRSIPLLPEGMSEPFRLFVFDLWLSLYFDQQGNYVHVMNNTSSTYKPYFSWLSVYVEWGGIVAFVILAIIGRMLWKIHRYASTPERRLNAVAISAEIIFLFLLGAQENYWEVPQAIFVGLILLKIQYGNFIYKQR